MTSIACRASQRPNNSCFRPSILSLHRGTLVIVDLRRPPQADLGIDAALVSRLAGGLVVGLALTGPLARAELVRQSAARGSACGRKRTKTCAWRATSPSPLHDARQIHHAVLQLAAKTEFDSVRKPYGYNSQPLVEESPDVQNRFAGSVTCRGSQVFWLDATPISRANRGGKPSPTPAAWPCISPAG